MPATGQMAACALILHKAFLNFVKLVGAVGFEPTATWSRTRCATSCAMLRLFGSRHGSNMRPSVNSRTLYPLSYWEMESNGIKTLFNALVRWFSWFFLVGADGIEPSPRG